MKKVLKILLGAVCLILAGIGIYAFFQFRDRHPNYQVDLRLATGPGPLEAGFAKVDITPDYFETWEDVNGNAKYDPDNGDRYIDKNGNGKFDAIWLAGFHNARPAQGAHDQLWARAMVLRSGDITLALCVIDMIGFGNDEVIATRKLISAALPEIDYVIVASTHVHSSPDVMGIWGPSEYVSGINKNYVTQVQTGIKDAVVQAFQAKKKARVKFAVEPNKLKDLVGDTRKPLVADAGLKLMQVIDAETSETLGTLMNWGNHPETYWSKNLQLSSDFADPWRNYVEQGITVSDSLVTPGIGGVAIFLNGAIGGLMTTHPDMSITDPYTGKQYATPSPEKIQAQGKALAKITLEKLSDTGLPLHASLDMGMRAKSIELSMDNRLFHLAAFLGIFDRGFVGWKKIRSEVSAWYLGPATFVHVPGELYPEILHGGIESPDGGDFQLSPVEVPSIGSQIPGQFAFFSGMSNDMIGYIIPKSQWDVEPPFTFGNNKRPYGEINSLGPETGPTIHRNVLGVLKELPQRVQ
jgi:hypothetical protein